MPTTSLSQLLTLNPCAEGQAIAVNALPDRPFTAAEARAAGVSFDDIVWGISVLARTQPEFRSRMMSWLDDCHTHAIRRAGAAYPLAQREADMRARGRDFVQDRLDAGIRAVTRAAGRVAWAAGKRAADIAARAAVSAARASGINARASAQDYAASAWASARDGARAGEQQWQFDRLVAWFSDPLPQPLPRL